jgi:3-methyladenine DNA glycosylase Mpg
MNGIDLTGNKLFIVSQNSFRKRGKSSGEFNIVRTGRIGIKEGRNLPYRYYIEGNNFVSQR